MLQAQRPPRLLLLIILSFFPGSQSQSQRLKAIEKLKEFKCRVLISTDLVSLILSHHLLLIFRNVQSTDTV